VDTANQIRNSRDVLASAKVARLTLWRNIMPYSLLELVLSVTSLSRRLKRQVNWANAMTRNCSEQLKRRNPESPQKQVTVREKLVHGTNHKICANNALPTFLGNLQGD
jgi:hypothetical protein